MRPPKICFAACLALASLAASSAPADTPRATPVTVSVVGKGHIRLMVSDGMTRPCDSSDNHMLFNERVDAGAEIKLKAATGSVCVDHTYGSLRESQWAGASIWSGSNIGGFGGRPQDTLAGTVSTDAP
jgi:hypothetical protein